MIRIREDKCVKLSGITSLFISFDFNLQIIETIKQTDKYVYDKKTHIWETPLTSLAHLLDDLTYIDDIELQLLSEDTNKKHYYPTLKYKVPPFQHQLVGVEWGLNVEKGLLLDAPGAGKTTQMIYLAEELKAQKGLKHCLIICGVNALKLNWKKEIHKFSDLDVRILGEIINSKGRISYASIDNRANELMSPIEAFYVITNVETLRYDEIIEALKRGPNKFGMIVLDEAHKCFVGDTLISTDGGELLIKDIVENKLDVKVKSYNHRTEKVEYKKIDSYFKSDKQESIYELEIIDDKENIHIIKCSADHPIFTANRGYVSAEDLDENDDILIDN